MSTNSFDIVFDYRFDTDGYFTLERRTTLEAAADIWESLIQEDFPDLIAGYDANVRNPQTGVEVDLILPEIDDLLIFVGFQSPPFGDTGATTLGSGGFRGNTTGTLIRNRVRASNFEPWVGNISFNPSPGGGTINDWFFDQTPATDDDIPDGKIDFLSVAIHEIAHVLGLGTAPISDQQGSDGTLDSYNALLVNNGQPILLEPDLSHFEEGIFNDQTLMDPLYNNDQRVLPSVYDLAWLADIGYDIQPTDGFNFVAQGASLPLATEGNDVTIFGTILADTIDGLGGDDQIQGDLGHDILFGGVGNDLIFGEEDNDQLFGNDGDDELQGGIGSDELYGGEGADNLFGQGDNDILFGDSGNDFLRGGDGQDFLDGGADNDTLVGEAGIDRFYFGFGNGEDFINDFEIATEVIEVTAEYGFADGEAILATLSKPFSNVSQFNLSAGNYIRVFHDSQSGTPLTAANFLVSDNVPGRDPAANDKPTITSGTTVNVAENSTGTVYTATATDPDGDTLTYSLGGTDAELFAIDSNSGTVTFLTPPDFETPTDDGADNTYNITVTASDSTLSSDAQNVAIAITDVNEAPTVVALENAATTLAEDVDITAQIKVADITITDDALGDETITLSGDDAALFEAVGTELFLKAGAALDFESNPQLDVTVEVDDDTVGVTPDVTTTLVIGITDVNETPTAVVLENAVTTFAEDTDTTAPVKVADITVTDDALGDETITLSGDDAAMFEAVGTELFLKAGAALDFETNPQLNITVEVDDDTVGTTPDVAADLAITVTDIEEGGVTPPPPPPKDPVNTFKDYLTGELIRFRNTDRPGTYLFAGIEESASIRENYTNFVEEGPAFQVATTKTDPLLQPFYRFQNTAPGREGTYLFAGSEEAASIRQNFKNFIEEGIAFYAYSAGVGGGTTEFSRFQNNAMPGTYLFAGPEESAAIVNNPNLGFTYEGVAFSAGG